MNFLQREFLYLKQSLRIYYIPNIGNSIGNKENRLRCDDIFWSRKVTLQLLLETLILSLKEGYSYIIQLQWRVWLQSNKRRLQHSSDILVEQPRQASASQRGKPCHQKKLHDFPYFSKWVISNEIPLVLKFVWKMKLQRIFCSDTTCRETREASPVSTYVIVVSSNKKH